MFDLVDRNLERLEAKIQVYQQVAAGHAGSNAGRLGSDPSPEGDRLTRYEQANQRRVHRCLEALWKYRRETGDSTEDAGRWAEDEGEGFEAENAADSAVKSGMGGVESSPQNKNFAPEANGGSGATEAEELAQVAASVGEINQALKMYSAMRDLGIGTFGTPVAGGGTGRSAIADMIFSKGPLLPPIS
jgi:hypothetical protein